jgi:phenylacetate-CoA ligase
MFPSILTENLIHPLRCRFNKWHRDVSNASNLLKRSEYYSLDELLNIQRAKLRRLCNEAAKGSEFYKKVFLKAGIDPLKIDAEIISELPVLDKTIIRQNFHDILNKNYPKSELIKNATGGSSGEPLVFYQSRHSQIMSAALTLRGYKTCNKKPGACHVKLWGAPTDVVKSTEGLKSSLWNYLYNKKTIDAFNAGPALFETEYNNYIRKPPYLLESYSNILYQFALYLQVQGKKPLSIPAAISSAGVLYDFQRTLIQKMISSNLFNRYGSREFGAIAHECSEHKGMHINMERFIIEVISPNNNGEGDIFVTDLENFAFPFIRYKIGDHAQISAEKCSCGRQSMMFANVTGRSLDVIKTKTGRMISGVLFPHFFKDYPEIIIGQVIQDRIDHIEIRLQLRPGASLDDIEPLINKIKKISNNELFISVNMEQDFIVNPTGKYRPVISKII